MKVQKISTCVVLALVSVLYSINVIAQERKITWGTSASSLGSKLDQTFRLNCPPNGSIGSIWGTDIYTSDSSICTAAAHSGLITARDGGRVRIRIRPGAEFYNGTTRNGITTNGYGSYQSSFIFLGSDGSPVFKELPIRLIQWGDSASGVAARLDQDFTFNCPPNGSIGSIWGTDIYTTDSSICTAAAHSGLITARDGGRVTIRIRPGEEFYNGTTRNGIKTNGYGRYNSSFIFLGK
ncbi:LCCL domain-containing protein [Chamaesiphon polymorphus]|uniref:LCCL domain-containing protein n=1 Tax=Chamaesiphon polymorphus CCALA 037 TaxID=2107692 RepID=A0A2T1GC77_9CYAN|nr:LCCL domain-containing protein [Chamaesiphon polymorphus]PSB54984.1 hypothetical protein C7B77_16470 [Chamaesiphon polymorphus CCALA 037]